MNKKGLTLIELLGVIIILGIIAAIAFPTVGGIIENQRKEGFAQNVNSFIDAAVLAASTEELETGEQVYVYDVNVPEDVQELNLSKSVNFKTGVVKIVFDDNGNSEVYVTELFSDGTYKLVGTALAVYEVTTQADGSETVTETQADVTYTFTKGNVEKGTVAP